MCVAIYIVVTKNDTFTNVDVLVKSLTLCACAAGLQQSFCVSVCVSIRYHSSCSRVDLCSPSVVPTESA